MSFVVDYSLQFPWHRINEVLDVCLVKLLPCIEPSSFEGLEVVSIVHRARKEKSELGYSTNKDKNLRHDVPV